MGIVIHKSQHITHLEMEQYQVQKKNLFLEQGTIIDRYGGEGGNYFAPVDTPIYQRSLAYGTDLSNYHKYEVLKSFEVESSKIAPAFGQLGGGTQYYSSADVRTLIKHNIIKEIFTD